MPKYTKPNPADGLHPVPSTHRTGHKLTRLLSPEAGLSPIARKVLIHRLEGKTEVEVCQCMGISRKRYLEALASFKRVSFADENVEVDTDSTMVSDSHQAQVLEEFASVAYRNK